MSAPAFPVSRLAGSARPLLTGETLQLRPAHDGDLDFLRRLYHSFRAGEMAPVPWSQAEKDAFLDDQFRLQHRHFTTVFPEADFLVVEQGNAPIGRLYLQRDEEGVLVVDIGLLPDFRRQGIGRVLMEWVLREAADAQAAKVWLHVLEQNLPARRLYEQLGFVVVGGQDVRMRMERRLPVS
ncbi:GNAT family N-acetyltransferase [Brevundimonas sp.]|uniref:GNAT family N-acetyltransferase n=1 Tax=Brevundimonas sp. TaxID=1871086 RepID=UPI003FA5E9EA